MPTTGGTRSRTSCLRFRINFCLLSTPLRGVVDWMQLSSSYTCARHSPPDLDVDTLTNEAYTKSIVKLRNSHVEPAGRRGARVNRAADPCLGSDQVGLGVPGELLHQQ